MQDLCHYVSIQYPMIKCNIVWLATIKVSTTSLSKRSLKVAATNIVKRVRAEQEKSISLEFILSSQNKSDLDI